MSITQNEVVEYIKNLRLADVKGLIETLEKELGVSAAGRREDRVRRDPEGGRRQED
jgi:ribosomal protein L7/L12